MTNPLLSMLPYVGQRSATFRFLLVDGPTGQNLGELHPLRGSPATLTHDTTRTIKRDLSLSLGVEDSARINVIRDRVAVSMILGGVSYPLGRFLFADDTGNKKSSGTLRTEKLIDEMFVIDQKMERGFAALGTVDNAITTLLAEIPGLVIDMEASGLSATGSWPAGTSRAKVLGDLCTQGGFFSPWFNNNNVLRIVRSFDPADRLPTFDFDAGNSVIRDTIAESNDLLDAPNKFVVVSNASTGVNATVAAVGTYLVPNSAPHSIANRGFTIPDVRDIQLTSANQAQIVAETIGITNTVFERTQLATAPDPRHDSYDVIQWDGEKWLELQWSMTLLEGAPMQHVMRKTYS
jgi:hypothetical protein